MNNAILFLHHGLLGERAARFAAKRFGGVVYPHGPEAGIGEAIERYGVRRVVLMLSGASSVGVVTPVLTQALRNAEVTWTAVHFYPTMLRIGPLIRMQGICFECASRRYYSMPGSVGLARLEELINSSPEAASLQFAGTPVSLLAVAAAEAVRQLRDDEVPGGFIRKIDLIESQTSSAVAIPLHGCTCSARVTSSSVAGARFYCDIARDIGELIGADAP
jgi:hypothetical protein